jgi:CheY-like chemotaxis protein
LSGGSKYTGTLRVTSQSISATSYPLLSEVWLKCAFIFGFAWRPRTSSNFQLCASKLPETDISVRQFVNLLIVEDEKRMVELLRKGLQEEGHTVIAAKDGLEGWDFAKTYTFDVIILDIMMPRLDGYELAKWLRTEKVPTPILMLTAKDSVQDIVHGLDLGADDYLTKPFSFDELLARVRAISRRAAVPQPTILQVDDLLLDPSTRAGRRRAGDVGHASPQPPRNSRLGS